MKRGFTIIEMICILALMGIGASMVYPKVDTLTKSIQIKTAANMLINDLRFAKMYAVSKNKTSVYVSLIRDDKSDEYNGYLIYCPGNISSMVLKRVYLPKGIYITRENSTFSTSRIIFRTNGSVYPACTINLRDTNTGIERKITLTIGFTRIMEKE